MEVKTNAHESAIARVVEAYQLAVENRDLNAFMSLYDPSVRVFDAWGVWEYRDAAAWKVAIEIWFASHPQDQLKAVFEDVQVVTHAGSASVSAVVTYAVLSTTGELRTAIHNRLSWALQASGDVYKIVHEHTSMPVAYKDQKAIVLRERKA